ncbi:MAG: tetraacyldisaccharide 4'-kinase [Candidatus Omnitrophota bacterium]
MDKLKLYILSVMKGERKTPDACVVVIILSLFSLLYAIVLKCISFLYRVGILPCRKVSAKVISVGNITLGGTGKTPFTIMLAESAKAMGRNVAVLIRGYGEDESHLLKTRLGGIPVIVGADRYKSAKRAISKFGSDCIILDDGFQHRRLKRDLNIVLIDATSPFGNMKLFPAGILREELSRLKEADIAVLTKADMGAGNKPAIYVELKKIKDDIAAVESFYKPAGLKRVSGEIVPPDYIKGRRVALLAAIANPGYFEWMIKNLGADIVESFYYADHHLYSKKDADSVIEKCAREGIDTVITTEKDVMRSKNNGTDGLSGLIRASGGGKKVDLLSLLIETTVTRNKEEIVARLRSLFNS